MKRKQLSEIIGNIEDRHIAACVEYAPNGHAASPERKGHVKVKRMITIALAAVLILSLGVTAYGIKTNIASPEAARKVALQELEVWKEMGLISKEISFEGEPDAIVEIEEETGSDYWYGRLFHHSYDVRWFMGAIDDGRAPEYAPRRKYGCNLRVDTLTGKIVQANLEARPDDNEPPVGSEVLKLGDPEDPETQEKIFYYYDNFDDLFDADMTVDRFLSLLAKYWGFSGYTLADTVDTVFYDSVWNPVEADSLLKDMPRENKDNYYLTVFFDGDQKGAPMYLQLHQFPGYITLMFGTGHAVG